MAGTIIALCFGEWCCGLLSFARHERLSAYPFIRARSSLRSRRPTPREREATDSSALALTFTCDHSTHSEPQIEGQPSRLDPSPEHFRDRSPKQAAGLALMF